MAWSKLASGKGAGANGGTVTLNTVGADFIIAAVGADGSTDGNYNTNVPGISESGAGGSNTWTKLGIQHPATGGGIALWYTIPTFTGSSHQISGGGSSSFAAITVVAFASGGGSSPTFDQQSGQGSIVNTTSQPGAIMPSGVPALLVTAVMALNNSSALGISGGGFSTVEQDQVGVGGVNYPCGIAWCQQTSSQSSANPSWSHDLANAAAVMAAFIAASGGGTSLSWMPVVNVVTGVKTIVVASGMTPPQKA